MPGTGLIIFLIIIIIYNEPLSLSQLLTILASPIFIFNKKKEIVRCSVVVVVRCERLVAATDVTKETGLVQGRPR